jgi:5-formyltetrahydrofolate cyclo-ligase
MSVYSVAFRSAEGTFFRGAKDDSGGGRVTLETKDELRRVAIARRAAQPDKDALSSQILETLVSLPEFAAATTVMIYLDARSEVRTRPALPSLLAGRRRIVVPWCDGDHLRLFLLRDMAELAGGRFGILEPRAKLRDLSDRNVAPRELDLLAIPGVAFDRRGGRIGHGRGYFDRLLAEVRPDATLAGLAFECQMFDRVPMQAHDAPMHLVVTETGVSRRHASPA